MTYHACQMCLASPGLLCIDWPTYSLMNFRSTVLLVVYFGPGSIAKELLRVYHMHNLAGVRLTSAAADPPPLALRRTAELDR